MPIHKEAIRHKISHLPHRPNVDYSLVIAKNRVNSLCPPSSHSQIQLWKPSFKKTVIVRDELKDSKVQGIRKIHSKDHRQMLSFKKESLQSQSKSRCQFKISQDYKRMSEKTYFLPSQRRLIIEPSRQRTLRSDYFTG